MVPALHQQPVNAQGAVNAPPPISRPIDDHENVTREQRRGDGLDLSRVATILPITRHERSKLLVSELLRRVNLALRKSSGYVPSLLAQEWQPGYELRS
jgi:hypothetical protein